MRLSIILAEWKAGRSFNKFIFNFQQALSKTILINVLQMNT